MGEPVSDIEKPEEISTEKHKNAVGRHVKTSEYPLPYEKNEGPDTRRYGKRLQSIYANKTKRREQVSCEE